MSVKGNNHIDIDFNRFKDRSSLLKKANNLFVLAAKEGRITKRGGTIEIPNFKNFSIFLPDILYNFEQSGFSATYWQEKGKHFIHLKPKPFRY